MKKIQLLNLKEGAEINFSANTQNHTNEESDHYMKQTVKASVFEDLFSNKEYLLQLYQALHPEDTTVLESDLEYVTLQQVMANNPYNDLGFKVGSRLMILVEAQSTWTENIIVRCIMYLAQTWKDYFISSKQSVYASMKLEFPEPELYVLYTGSKTISKTEISLSEEFFAEKPIAIDAKVKVLITGKNNDIITQYVLFTKVIDEQRNLYKNNTQTAITETIRICKDKNILKEYLENHEKEVIDIMVTLYSQEEVLRDYVTSEKFTSEVKGIVELSQELGRSFADTVSYVAKKCNVSKDIAERKVNSFWN